MNPPSILTVAIVAIVTCSSWAQSAVSVFRDENQAIAALGGLTIDGQSYDVSFDGSFGERAFLGNQAGAEAARDAIAQLLNSHLGDPFFPWALPTLSNESGGGYSGTGTLFQVTYALLPEDDPETPGLRSYYSSQYAAGWTYNYSSSSIGESPEYVEATFRIAIPGSIVDNVPEPSPFVMMALGMAATIGLRRRESRCLRGMDSFAAEA